MNRAKQDKAELDIVSILEEDEINIYQALNKDYIQNKRDDLEKHLQGYRKIAEDFGIKKWKPSQLKETLEKQLSKMSFHMWTQICW